MYVVVKFWWEGNYGKIYFCGSFVIIDDDGIVNCFSDRCYVDC